MSYADVLEEYEAHRGPKSADQKGNHCSRTPRGLLQRREIWVGTVVYTTKKAEQIQDIETWLVHNWDEVGEIFPDPIGESLKDIFEKLWTLTTRALAKRLGITQRLSARSGMDTPGRGQSL
jgi:hypothetical protein